MLSKEDKKLVILSLLYLVLGNIIVPLVAFIITRSWKQTLIIYGYTWILAIIFWSYLGYKLLNPKELWKKLTS
jgi:hypothetical protein